MIKRNTSIKINGKHYDALTGSLLTHPGEPKQGHKSIDGVIGGTVKTAASSQPTAALPASQVPRAQAAHAATHKTHPSSTLMRHAVHKPATSSVKRRAKVQSSTLSTTTASVPIAVKPKASVTQVDPKRFARAVETSLSPKVAHFAHEVVASVPVALEHVVSELDKQLVVPTTPATAHVRVSGASGDIFEQALARATSHEEPAPYVKSTKARRKAARIVRHRMFSYGVGAMVVLVIAGFLGYSNVNNLKFRTAANAAGFAATMPSYTPSGFSVAGLSSTPGYIGVNYSGPVDSSNVASSFALTEKPSNWDSSTLLTNIMASANVTGYTTIQAAGRTVYVYGQNQAAWVDKGVLYQILGKGVLTTQEFGKIAASM